ncbi:MULTISPECIES: hypothetical protein [unclassified Shewanella]|uniref:hypothetical protein n=1 Tax=unclassified Shewanella TaxID=196818 RepID=UPI001BC2C832|nr:MULTISPECIES: hypothetical protein [unclassified Shewanella]GIU06798.1 hypothetical protein TUM4444_05250 [Shewanella sp. MBTL60-112-B1]GIU26343.1 hypothetical protein TUM4445_05410 [Shewanella sp. MBTL60-112-B2]
MSLVKGAALFITIFLMGYVTNNIFSQPTNLELILSYLTSFSTICAAIVACLALNSWRKQLKFSNIFSTATELEYALFQQLKLVCDDEQLQGKEAFGVYGLQIQTLTFRLRQRKYQPEILTAIDVSYDQGLNEARVSGQFSKKSVEELLSALRRLTKAINQDFR